MKLPLRYFLILSLLSGAVAVPVGWRQYQKWKAAEVERLEVELNHAYEGLQTALRNKAIRRKRYDDWPEVSTDDESGKWDRRIESIEHQLTRLTGVQRQRRQLPVFNSLPSF